MQNKLIRLILGTSLFSLVTPFFAHPFAGGSGTPGDPFQISTCQQLQDISQNLTASYELINAIDCSDTKNWNNGAGFIPVGTITSGFSGSLNGNNHVITNLYIKSS